MPICLVLSFYLDLARLMVAQRIKFYQRRSALEVEIANIYVAINTVPIMVYENDKLVRFECFLIAILLKYSFESARQTFLCEIPSLVLFLAMRCINVTFRCSSLGYPSAKVHLFSIY